MAKVIAVDTETTGLDIWHGCKPFFVATIDDEGLVKNWEWEVDINDRVPIIPKEHIKEIANYLGLTSTKKLNAPTLVFHNSKFDIRALQAIGLSLPNWNKVEDTHLAHHCLASSESHALKDLALLYLDIDNDDEKELHAAVNKARNIAKKLGWAIANEHNPHTPTQISRPKKGWGVMDMWLPKQIAEHEAYDTKHPWHTLTKTYATLDVVRTMGLWWVFKEALQEQKLWEQYQQRKKLLPITYKMESEGITANKKTLTTQLAEYKSKTDSHKRLALQAAKHKIDNLASPKQLEGLLFGTFNITPIKTTKKGNNSTDKDTLGKLKHLVDEGSPAHTFLHNLEQHRQNETATEYVQSYLAGGLPKGKWLLINPTFNVAGTATTRLSSNNPNAQNISKREDFNLRKLFGPVDGYIWVSMDYENIEMRIPAYKANEKKLIELFENGGSYHLLISEILHSKKFKDLGPKKFKDTEEYRKVKNGNFAKQYGGQKATVDKAYGVVGGFDVVNNALPNITKLSRYYLDYAIKHGYIYTETGYKLQCPRYDNGGIIPTTPFNYYIQGSAGIAMQLAMIACDKQIELWKKNEQADMAIIMTIHDELIFRIKKQTKNIKSKLQRLKQLMEDSGKVMGMPLPVDCGIITNNWAEEISLEEAEKQGIVG